MQYVLGIDIGGTKIAAGAVTSCGQLREELTVPTPESATSEDVLSAVIDVAKRLLQGQSGCRGIGVGIAGLVDWPSGFVRCAPNSPYHNLPLRAALENALGLPVVVDNDGNAAVLGEARFGAAAGMKNVVLLAIGTGIGGGILVDSAPLRGASGHATEIGHVVIDCSPTARQCGCGKRGCLEAIASGTALAQTARDLASADPQSLVARLARQTGAVDGRCLERAARSGDANAGLIFEEFGRVLGLSVASMVAIFDPEIVVLTGGIAASCADLFLPSLEATYSSQLIAADMRSHRPEVRLAQLGHFSGTIGAACLVLDNLATDARGLAQAEPTFSLA